MRVAERADHDFVIFGGEDHKTGQVDGTVRCFERLEAAERRAVPSLDVTHRWSGQVIETNDGLPFIGETSSRQFAATGFARQRHDVRELAGMMAHDACTGRQNPWQELFDLGRTKVRGGAWDYLKENVDYPAFQHDSGDRISSSPTGTLAAGACRRAKARCSTSMASALPRLAVPRPRHDGLLRPAHGCLVEWNRADKTGTCPATASPAAGARWGGPLRGPAETPLEPMHLPRPGSRQGCRHYHRTSRVPPCTGGPGCERRLGRRAMAALAAIAEPRTAAGDVGVHAIADPGALRETCLRCETSATDRCDDPD